MTYTFKLARRLAVSRTLALAVFAACSGGDATAPDGSPAHPLTPGSQDDPRFRQTAPLTVSISPSRVTVETNQLIRFLAQGRNSAGDSVGAFVQWSATGGTILADGRYSAASTGTFLVIGRSLQREQDRVDTSYVEVVRRQIRLSSLEISPGSTTLAPGLSQTFLVTGYLQGGQAVPIGATWAATGGTIDAGGNYVAGDTAGTYQVIATHTVLSLADTAIVTITAPAPPPPPAPGPPPPPPPPALVQVTLRPASATLAPFTTRQFVAFGRTAAGDSVALTPTFAATGGSITGGGLYSAGGTPGTFRVIASSGSLADTSSVVVTEPLGSGPPGSGIPVGLWGLLSSDVARGPYTFSADAYAPGTILSHLSQARSQGLKVLMNMTGGAHVNYMTNGVFDMAKWVAKMDSYNTPAIRAAVAAGVADGTIIGNSVMDEPQNTSIYNSWGPAGTLNKARVDTMCAYVKNMFPTLQVGVVHDYSVLEPQVNYQHCEWVMSQYRLSKGEVTRYRDGALAFGRRSGVAIMFSLNILHGGVPGTTCPKYFDDPQGDLCPMTPEQLRSWGLTLGSVGCALNMWRHAPDYFNDPANQAAVRDIADSLANLPRRPCTRPRG